MPSNEATASAAQPSFLAAIDVGSKAVRMVLGALHPNGDLHVLRRWRAHLSLGQYVFRQHLIPADTVQELQRVLQTFRADLPPEVELRITATSAVREATNRDQVLQRLRTTGLNVQVLEGEEEAELIRHALETLLPEDTGPVLFADLGGGSLELSLLHEGNLLLQRSVPQGVTRPHEMPEHWRQVLEPLCDGIEARRRFLVLSGGSARDWAKVIQQGEPAQTRSSVSTEFHWTEALGKAGEDVAEGLFSALGRCWQPDVVMVSRVSLKEALLLKLAESLLPAQSCHLKMPLDVPLVQVRCEHEWNLN